MATVNLYIPQKLDINIEFPSTWNELQHKEIYFLAKTLLTESNSSVIRALIIKYILENRSKKLPKQWFLKLDPVQLVTDAYPLVDFIFNDNNLTNPPDDIIIRNRRYQPQIFEEKITCGQYEDCEVIAGQFNDHPEKEALVKLAGILYAPEKKIKWPWRKRAEKQKEKYFKKLPPEKLYAIFIWYAGSRAQLPQIFPTVYEGGNGNGPDMMAFTKCIHAGAGPKNGSRAEIRAMKLYEFMFDMEQEAELAKKIEEEAERMKNQ